MLRIKTSTQYCSGVLLNNTSYDGKAYVLTVEHCIRTQSTASLATFYFNYESPSCNGGDGSKDSRMVGSFFRNAGDSIDFSLVELYNKPPDEFNAYYAGWNLDLQHSPDYTTIHHPMGDVKKISVDKDNISIPQSKSDVKASPLWDYHFFSFWWIHEWDLGSTEAGSSGSPLFDPNKRVIGILSGGAASCGNNNINDYYTRMDIAWDYNGSGGPNLKTWLDPSNTGLRSIGGYNPVTNAIPSKASGKI